MGSADGCQHGCRRDAEGPDRSGYPGGWPGFVSSAYPPVFSAGDLAAHPSADGLVDFPCDRRALARDGQPRMPPYLDFTMHSAPGEYHGFFWFYFMNEHVLRFLGLRYPHDYNTVPRLTFWCVKSAVAFSLEFLSDWSRPFSYRAFNGAGDRASRTRLLAICWAGFLLLFFTFSTTQEYYSMPIYPALALLLAPAMEADNRWTRLATRGIAVVASSARALAMVILYAVRNVQVSGDISSALDQHPSAYTLSLGHMGDLTLRSFAYLRLPLTEACVALLIGAAGCWAWSGRRSFFAILAMMVLFFTPAE